MRSGLRPGRAAPALLILVGGLLAAAAAFAPARAQTNRGVAVTVERDTRARLALPLLAPLRAMVSEDGVPPARRFELFASADNGAGEQTQAFPCVAETDPGVPPGVYDCSVFVTRGGQWTFTVFVNELRVNPKAAPVRLAQATTRFEVVADVVSPNRPAKRIAGKATEVVALFGHSLAGGLWFISVALLALLAVPAARSRLSPGTVSALERRLDILPRAAWAATALVIGSGTYLMLKLVPYKTPFTLDAFHRRAALPYGRPYFLSLAAKLIVYAVMLLTTPLLIREARRRSRLQGQTVKSGWWVWATAAVVAAGAPAIILCVTLLKYFHELIEATRAVT
jgi:hypothetical protein